MTREEMLALKPGDRVVVQYLGYEIEADVVKPQPHGWVLVAQVTDYEDQDERPTFEAACEFMSRPGEKRPAMPFGALYAVIGRSTR